MKIHNPYYEPVVVGEDDGSMIEIYYNGINHYCSVLKEDQTSAREEGQYTEDSRVGGRIRFEWNNNLIEYWNSLFICSN